MRPTARNLRVYRLGVFASCGFCIATMLYGSAVAVAEESAVFPSYSVSAHCNFEFASGAIKYRQDCEDREHAITILLRHQWADLSRTSSDLVSNCLTVNSRFTRNPSYLGLLQCVTAVRDAAD